MCILNDVLFQLCILKMTILGKNISQGSVATNLRCGGIFNNHFTTNFLKNASVKEFQKSVKILQRYRYEFDAPFFETQCISHSLFV